MAGQLSRTEIIRRDDLREIAESRLAEAELLVEQGYAAACVYLAGYAVECYLKYAICRRLNWDALLGAFKVHDLEGLLLYSGLDKELRSHADVSGNFRRICSVWKIEADKSVRYQRPSEFTDEGARKFLTYVSDPQNGVVAWLQNNVR